MKMAYPKRMAMLLARRGDYQTLDSVELSEPRIAMIHRRLQALLRVVQLESGGEPVEIDGFRLRDPAHWVAPQPPAFSELWHISNACNMRCPFCYEEGDPEGCTVLADRAGMVTMSEIETRLKYRDPERGTGLFRPITNMNEPFCHPQILEIIERLREHEPGRVLMLVTNGSYLSEEVVARLAKCKPLFFNFSVNSLDPRIREKVLLDRDPQRAIRAVELLQEYRIPYVGSLVCWPTVPWSDIGNTVRKLDQYGCAVIRFSLSAYSQHLKGKNFQFDLHELWDRGIELARRLMDEVDTPIKVEPYHYLDRSYLPNLAGVIKGSPAWRAGLRAADRLISVDGRRVPSANHALSALAAARRRGTKVRLAFRRHGSEREERLELDEATGPFDYPYAEMVRLPGFDWGLVLVENLRFSYLQEMRRTIDQHGARRVLILSSMVMKPIVEKMLEASRALAGVEVELGVPENHYFGGNISLGDLLVVEDFVRFLNDYRSSGGAADLVLIPSSPFSSGGWHRDLAGVPFTEIERRVGMATELIFCHPLNG